MRKSLKFLLCVLLAILLALAALAYRNRNSIEAFLDAMRYSQEDIDKRLEENKSEIQKYMEEKDITVRDLTPEELAALEAGEVTEEELADRIINPENSPGNPETPTPTSDVKKPSENPEEDKAVSAAIAKLYVQKNKYLGKLDAIEAHVRGVYIAMSPEERKGAKQRLLNQYISQVAGWESECDAAVYAILEEIRAAVLQSGQDEGIVTKLESAYLSEKKAKKAYFINRYMD